MFVNNCTQFISASLKYRTRVSYETLVSTLGALDENRFVTLMNKSTKHTRLASEYTFSILWGKLHLVVHQLVGPVRVAQILKDRSESGYRQSMSLPDYVDSDTLCTTAASDLKAREDRIDAACSDDTLGFIGTEAVKVAGTRYHRSVTSALCSILDRLLLCWYWISHWMLSW